MNRAREAWLGVVIVGALVLTVVGTLWLEGSTFGRAQREVEAVFAEVGLIRPGNSVKLRGVEVGRVREIAFDPSGGAVRLRFTVSEDLVIPPDAVMILSPESMFGDWQAEIVPRSRYPNVAYTESTEDGVLPGYALPDISELTHMADQIAGNLSILSERLSVAFSDETATNIASLIDNVEEVTERLSELVSQQATSFTEVTDGVLRAVDNIGSAADQAQVTFQRVDDLLAREELATTLSDLSVITTNLKNLSGDFQSTNVELRQMAARADSAFVHADAIFTRMSAGDGTLGRLLQDSQMADEMTATVTELKVLLTDIRENPRRYLRLSVF